MCLAIRCSQVKVIDGTKDIYDVIDWFLDYLNGLRNGFVADLNKKLRTGYVLITLLSCLGRLLISFGVTTRPGMVIK